MKRVFFGFWYLPIFVSLTIVSGLLCLLVSCFSRRACRYITSQVWARIVLSPARIKVDVRGREHLPASGGFIIYANHRSLLDIPAVAEATGRQISWIAKAALGRIPVFGWVLMRVHMLVDRGGGSESARKMLAEASERLARGEIMAIFPEGTRNRTDEALLPFKKGAFILAKHTGAPLVPLAIFNSGRLWPGGSFLPRPGRLKTAVGRPVHVAKTDSLDRIAQEAQQVLAQMYRQLEFDEPSASGAAPAGGPGLPSKERQG
jgi:1-acyl-sn-glycerol-3-phosphate acyltransferase